MSVILSAGAFVAIAFVLRAFLPENPAIPVSWGPAEIYIPLNMAAFWASMVAAVLVGIIQAIRVMLRDAQKLR